MQSAHIDLTLITAMLRGSTDMIGSLRTNPTLARKLGGKRPKGRKPNTKGIR